MQYSTSCTNYVALPKRWAHRYYRFHRHGMLKVLSGSMKNLISCASVKRWPLKPPARLMETPRSSHVLQASARQSSVVGEQRLSWEEDEEKYNKSVWAQVVTFTPTFISAGLNEPLAWCFSGSTPGWKWKNGVLAEVWQVWSKCVPPLAGNLQSVSPSPAVWEGERLQREFTKAKSGSGKICRAQRRWAGQDGKKNKDKTIRLPAKIPQLYVFIYFCQKKQILVQKNDLYHSISWLLCILAIKKCLHSGIPSNQLDLNPNGWVILSLYICWVTLVVIKTASFHGHSWNFLKARIFSFSLHPSDLFAI